MSNATELSNCQIATWVSSLLKKNCSLWFWSYRGMTDVNKTIMGYIFKRHTVVTNSNFFNKLRLIYYVVPTSFPTTLRNVRVKPAVM